MSILSDIKDKLNKLCIWGEVEEDGKKLFWYHTEDEYDSELAADLMWDAYCEDAQIIRKEGYEIEESWQNNDSCGFDIIIG